MTLACTQHLFNSYGPCAPSRRECADGQRISTSSAYTMSLRNLQQCSTGFSSPSTVLGLSHVDLEDMASTVLRDYILYLALSGLIQTGGSKSPGPRKKVQKQDKARWRCSFG
ncbi:Uncharacterized protein HZ326_27803 [Fusarium oxysporum f. sp. albedinis]|nr:Uncharacterized protein HZ326_27803 [Fusarium oxysporum f. sp. albedinis]